jgi:hypothetical protein
MIFTQVGLWIDSNRALIVFPNSLTARVVESRSPSPAQFYDDVIRALGTPGAVLIMGPGDTKSRLSERLAATARRAGWVVSLEPSACTRDRDIVAELADRLQPE